MGGPADTWALGEAYEPYIGRWSRLVAAEFVAWLGVADGAVWLDVGCGTDALGRTVLGAADPALVVAADPVPGPRRLLVAGVLTARHDPFISIF